MKRTSAPTIEELNAALDAASKGRAGKLVDIIRSFSRADLIWGLSHSNGRLAHGLAYASGRKEQRAMMSAEARELRKKWRAAE